MVVKPLDRVKLVMLLFPAKTRSPIVVTLLGMVIEVRVVQLSNAELPIEVILFGIVIEVRPVQAKQKLSGIAVNDVGIFTLCRL